MLLTFLCFIKAVVTCVSSALHAAAAALVYFYMVSVRHAAHLPVLPQGAQDRLD
jgi:hypothetical protein